MAHESGAIRCGLVAVGMALLKEVSHCGDGLWGPSAHSMSQIGRASCRERVSSAVFM